MQALPENHDDWTQVPVRMPWIDPFTVGSSTKWQWCDRNCKDKFDALFEQVDGKTVWIFKSPEDATMFKLVWSHR